MGQRRAGRTESDYCGCDQFFRDKFGRVGREFENSCGNGSDCHLMNQNSGENQNFEPFRVQEWELKRMRLTRRGIQIGRNFICLADASPMQSVDIIVQCYYADRVRAIRPDD